MLLYLHGFRSSPDSTKGRQLRAAAEARGVRAESPHLDVSARIAIAQCEAIITASSEPVTVIGSSLGGHYATWLAEKHGLRAVLINPAVVAELDFTPQIGTLTHYHSGEPFEFTAQHVAELQELIVPTITRPERYWLLLERGDEILDYRHAVAKYAGAKQTVLPGGDHSFTRWSEYLDDIFLFAAG